MIAVFASCSKDGERITEDPAGKVRLKVSLRSGNTRVLGDTANDLQVRTAQVFVYNSRNVLEDYSGVVSDTDDIELAVIPGQKTLFAVVNAPQITPPDSLAILRRTRSLLKDNQLSRLVMSGEVTQTVMADAEVTIPVSHICCKVIVNKITRDFSDGDLVEVPMSITRLSMSNVAGDCDYACSGSNPTLWINQAGVVDTNYERADLLVEDIASAPLANLASYEQTHVFYVYPNPVTADSYSNTFSPRHTRLMITADYNGHACYYPVTLPGSSYGDGHAQTLERNKVYCISELTLTKPGSFNPDNPGNMVNSEVGFTCTVEVVDWDDYTAYNEIY